MCVRHGVVADEPTFDGVRRPRALAEMVALAVGRYASAAAALDALIDTVDAARDLPIPERLRAVDAAVDTARLAATGRHDHTTPNPVRQPESGWRAWLDHAVAALDDPGPAGDDPGLYDWARCVRCERERPVHHDENAGAEQRRRRWSLARSLICEACALEACQRADRCPEIVATLAGVLPCRRSWHHTGRCEPSPLPLPVPPTPIEVES